MRHPDGTTRAERKHLHEGIDRYLCIGLPMNVLSVQLQWTDSLGVAHLSFPVKNHRFTRRCAMSDVSVGKENSTDVELDYKLNSAFVIIAALPSALISRAVVARILATDSGSADNAIHSA
jgi:hypothetical protein